MSLGARTPPLPKNTHLPKSNQNNSSAPSGTTTGTQAKGRSYTHVSVTYRKPHQNRNKPNQARKRVCCQAGAALGKACSCCALPRRGRGQPGPHQQQRAHTFRCLPPGRGSRAALEHYVSDLGQLEIPNALCTLLHHLATSPGWQAEGTGSPPLRRRGALSRKGSPRRPGT